MEQLKHDGKKKPSARSDQDKQKRVYFDWAASSPDNTYNSFSFLDKEIFRTGFANPSSSMHLEGRSAKKILEESRERCAAVLKVPPETLYFTSGGTESNSIALLSNLTRPGKGRIISSQAEHASVRDAMLTLEKMGKPTGNIPVDSSGKVTPASLSKTLEKYGDVRFISVMSVNNETGVVTDIASLSNEIKKYREYSADSASSLKNPVHFHCDMVQAAGKIKIDIDGWDIDSASISAHKIQGPRGIGLLYAKKPLNVFYSGGGQENGVRGGTENVYGAFALADCLEKYASSAETEYQNAKTRIKKLITSLCAMKRCVLIPKSRLADDDNFSPYILQAAFKDIPGEVMARALDDLGFAVSTGSACSSSSPERPVLIAMGVEENLRIEGIRISQGHTTTDKDIDLLTGAVNEVLKFL
ncbi:MAG: aminotransferase class V-fold PLP-dependent enzyme [Treponema sp.]|nr:aminotransferase class V-fold PLP-dependent enzyme [Treponema sp.]